jgi:hypothetical protein
MKKTIFKILGVANRERCDMEGYSQCFIAFDIKTEKPVAYHYTGPAFPISESFRFIERRVASFGGSPEEAIRRFREWQAKGYTEEWLYEDPIKIWFRPLPD